MIGAMNRVWKLGHVYDVTQYIIDLANAGKISVYSSRTLCKSGYAIYENGGVIDYSVGKTVSDNIKEDVLLSMTKGLRACRSHISHDDILYIEVQNRHLCEWLNGSKEYKGYSDYLDMVFEVLESLDCRYRFIFVDKPTCKSIVEKGKVEVKGSSVESAFSDLE